MYSFKQNIYIHTQPILVKLYTIYIFLDVTVTIEEESFTTDLYCKPTDCHQFLDYGSAHPIHNKRSIVYSQCLRIKRLCSSENKCSERLEELRSWFGNRGYPKGIVDSQLRKVTERRREDLLTRRVRRKSCGVPLVVTYNPRLSKLGNIIRKHLPILYSNTEAKTVFSPAPFVSFRSGYSLTNHLVRAKVYPLERKVGSHKCGRSRCQTCNNVQISDTFESFTDKKSYKINHYLSCEDKCLIYLLSCKVCGLQYVGQTTDKFRFRWNNYKACQRKAALGDECPQLSFHRHFLSENHTGLVNDCTITLIDKTDAKDPTRRENVWIRKLKTLAPLGLNMEESK